MKIGTYYYPEQWPREQWERDFDRIAAMGLKIVHFAEFAWFDLEPSPGQFEFGWLEECIEMAAKRKLDVILCTPTAAPPVWLTDQYPEVLTQFANGTTDRHGGRRHYAPTSLRMQEASQRITAAMAEKFGDHPAVVGWQIDNELGHGFDQHEYTHVAFRKWLQEKYGTIEQLNKAWANQFWNQYYTTFDQILMPGDRSPNYKNPHHRLDASRFWSRAWADFVKLQADILKPKIGNRWITTNFMPFFQDCDPNEMRDSLSLWSWDTYPISGLGGHHKGESFRLPDASSVEVIHDQMASYNGRWGLMEVQPGQINWSGVPCLPYPGAIRLLLWSAIAHGAEFITVYRFRQPRFGIEMWHDGLVQLDGITPSPGGLQFRQVAEECRRIFGDAPEQLPAVPQPKAGLVIDFDQLWWCATLPQANKWRQEELIIQWHQALSRMGFKVEILHPNQPWPEGLKVVVVPAMQLVDPSNLSQFNEYVQSGGHLVLTPRTALQDRNGQFFEGRRGSAISELIGGDVEAYDSLPDGVKGIVDIDTKHFEWHIWGDLLFAGPGTKIWAKYGNMFYHGATAVTHAKRGTGSVTYCGVFAGRDFADAIIERLCTAEGLGGKPLPDGVRVVQRGNLRIAMNFTDHPATIDVPAGTTFVLGGRNLEPAGVAVWRE